MTSKQTAASMLRQCIDKATFPTSMDKHSALQWIDELASSAPPQCLHQIAEPAALTELDAALLNQAVGMLEALSSDLRSHGNDSASEGAACSAGAVQRLAAALLSIERAAAPQAVQPAAPLPLLLRDIARDLGITVPQACIALKPLGNYSTNSAVTAEMARMLRAHLRAAPAHPAEGVPAAKNGRHVLVDSGALQMVLNALERDALEGKHVRAEMRLDLMQSITQPAAQGLDALKEARNTGINHGVCLALQIMTAAGDAGSAQWNELVDVAGRAELERYAKLVELEEWELGGFAQVERSKNEDATIDAALAAQAKQGEQE